VLIGKKNMLRFIYCLIFLWSGTTSFAQSPDQLVNVFLGSSGDHGQLSPAASSPFSQLSILPQTNPTLHTGYEYLAKNVLGFTHNRLEGVGCQGSGGIILIKPFLGKEDEGQPLTKIADSASPGSYTISFKEGIETNIAVDQNYGMYNFNFPTIDKGFSIDFSHVFNQAFVGEKHTKNGDVISGWVKAKTTCKVGIYTIYYAIQIDHIQKWQENGTHGLVVNLDPKQKNVDVRVAFSAVDEAHAIKMLNKNKDVKILTVREQSAQRWNNHLSSVKVEGDKERVKLFYSLLYRTMQSPYLISESDKTFKGTDGKLHLTKSNQYHGWAIWDNYKTQLPLLSILFPDKYQDMIHSIGDLYRYGKYDFAGPQEPANSVRTEHSVVVLLDALKKGYKVDFTGLKDSLLADTARFDFTKPDKYLEACYDMWAMGKLFDNYGEKELSKHFFERAQTYKTVWNREFKDLNKKDVDRMSVRNMYQGTIRQYRWSVPFNVQGLLDLSGGRQEFTRQLDDFFDNYYFNRANEPDLQSPTLYYASTKPWKYQELVQRIALDTVVQYYFNDNSRGIGAHIDRIYKNEPKAFVRTMDDDAGAMSGWFVMTAIGLQQPLVGEPVYYLNVPLFSTVTLNGGKVPFVIKVSNFDDKNRYIKGVTLNGNKLDRLWIRHDEIQQGGILEIEAGSVPSDFGSRNMWIP
jgi:putative alpha-1,2-mannosidase